MEGEINNSQFCVNIYCVMPTNATEATCPRDLFQAYECCRENGFNVSWLEEADALRTSPTKEDVFIMSEFAGRLFTHLQRFKCTIIGPQCLLVSVQKGEPLPDTPFPVFTVAMKGIVVTTTGCSQQEKKLIQEKVQYMGGVYISAFHGNVTHLIVKSVAEFSPKFKVAIQRDVPVMTPQWVEAVWAASLKEAVHGTDPIFARYACPPFQGLVVCVSQLPVKERDALRRIIEANGGSYCGQLEMGRTNILIVTSAEGEKYSYARKWKIRCIKPDWVHQSLNKGYAVDPEPFLVVRGDAPPRSSTPEPDQSVRGLRFGDASINSTIFNESHVQHVNETAASNITTTTTPTGRSGQPANQLPPGSAEAIESLELGLAKRAGPFLDGCKVFTTGFDEIQGEKLRRVMNGAGVARFAGVSESLSHVVAGRRIEEHWRQLEALVHKPHVVTAEWVLQSLRLQRPAPEGPYLHPEFAQLVQAGIAQKNKEELARKLSNNRPEETQAQVEEDTQMVQQYLTGMTDAEPEPEAPQGMFSGLTFHLVNLDQEAVGDFEELITSHGGKVVNSTHNGYNYFVTEPASHAALPVVPPGTVVVNTLWLEDCSDQEQLVELEVHHKHVVSKDPRRLSGSVVAFSGIQGRLRDFLQHLVRSMDGITQETFSRKSVEERGVLKSTHLVTVAPEGKKYEKALEWGVPAIDPRWILACAEWPADIDRPLESDYPPGAESFPEPPPTPAASLPLPSPVSTPKVGQGESLLMKAARQRRLESLQNTPTDAAVPVASPRTALLTPGTSFTSVSVTPHPRPTVAAHRMAAINAMTPGTPLLLSQASPQPQPSGLFNIPTPKTPYGRLFNNDPSPDTRKMWKSALDNRVRLTPRLDRDDDDDQARGSEENGDDRSPHSNGEVVIHPSAEDYFANLAKKFRSDDGAAMAAPIRSVLSDKPDPTGEENAAKSSLPFQGVVAYLHKKIEEQRELINAVKKLGGETRFVHCQEVTHYVYSGKLPASKEVKAAKEWHQKFVAPAWILDSEDANARMEESQYPTSLNPKMTLSSLNFSSQPTPPAPSTQKRRHVPLPSTSSNDDVYSTPKTATKRAAPPAEPSQHVSELLEEEACQQLLQLEQVVSRTTELSEANDSVPARLKANSANAAGFNLPATQTVPAEAPDSQSVPITWDLQETVHHTQHDSPPISSIPTYRIIFSSIDQDLKDECIEVVKKLGGTVLDLTNYDPSITHIVVAKVGTNEKLLTSVAAGKWVLHPDWLTDSGQAGRFLHEPDYEWGNPEALVPLDRLVTKKDEMDIARAAHYWRKCSSNQGKAFKGPFSGIRAVLYLRDKNDSFRRLLEAGGGEVVDSETALENGRANLCLTDQRELKKLDMAKFADCGVYIVQALYLRNVVLTTDGMSKPKWIDAVFPEFKPFLDRIPNN